MLLANRPRLVVPVSSRRLVKGRLRDVQVSARQDPRYWLVDARQKVWPTTSLGRRVAFADFEWREARSISTTSPALPTNGMTRSGNPSDEAPQERNRSRVPDSGSTIRSRIHGSAVESTLPRRRDETCPEPANVTRLRARHAEPATTSVGPRWFSTSSSRRNARTAVQRSPCTGASTCQVWLPPGTHHGLSSGKTTSGTARCPDPSAVPGPSTSSTAARTTGDNIAANASDRESFWNPVGRVSCGQVSRRPSKMPRSLVRNCHKLLLMPATRALSTACFNLTKPNFVNNRRCVGSNMMLGRRSANRGIKH